MTVIRVPYPDESERRQAVFARATGLWVRHNGTYQGDTDTGTFDGRTPIGRFRGAYHAAPGTGEMELNFAEKPWLVPSTVIAHYIRKVLNED
jgi:hypothetical protein